MIDTKNDRDEIKGRGYAYTFKCDSPKIVKQIKITATKTTENNYLILSRVEFFGSMSLNKCPLPFLNLIINRNTCVCKKTSLHIYLFLLIMNT